MALSIEAEAVRRHGHRMMVGMAVMKVALHLKIESMKAGSICQMRVYEFLLSMRRHWEQDDCMKRSVAIAMLAGLAALAGSATPLAPVDVNHATVAELMHVPGMTPVWAARIVRFRPYRTKLDLLEQGVVTPEVYHRIRASVVAHHVR